MTENYEKACIKHKCHIKHMATCVIVTEQSKFCCLFKHNWVAKMHHHSLGFGECKSVATGSIASFILVRFMLRKISGIYNLFPSIINEIWVVNVTKAAINERATTHLSGECSLAF